MFYCDFFEFCVRWNSGLGHGEVLALWCIGLVVGVSEFESDWGSLEGFLFG